jgi:hypothetical protein
MVRAFSALQTPQEREPLSFRTKCRAEDHELRAASCAVPKHGAELSFGDGEAVRCQALWSAGDLWAWCSSNVVDGVVAHLVMDIRGANEVRKFGDPGVDRSTATDDIVSWGSANWQLVQGQTMT